jgi:hypothetical protein
MAQPDHFQHQRAPRAQHLPPVTPPVVVGIEQLREDGDGQRRSMNLTDEQHAICQAARDLDVGSSLKIQAFAGTGKTTTLAAIAESLAERKFLYLVFNRAAADEAEHKMSPNVTVRTAHALAFRSVGYIYKSRLAGSPWAWFPKEKMPRALDSVVRMGRDATSAGALIIRMLEQFLRKRTAQSGRFTLPIGVTTMSRQLRAMLPRPYGRTFVSTPVPRRSPTIAI